MKRSEAGFREVEHTADWQLDVWAPDLPALFEQAARGMYRLSGARPGTGLQQEVRLQLQASDLESLLVSFLTELLYYSEQERLIFDAFELQIEDTGLKGRLRGLPLAAQDKEIKAVTYHNMQIKQSDRGYEVQIVFDV